MIDWCSICNIPKCCLFRGVSVGDDYWGRLLDVWIPLIKKIYQLWKFTSIFVKKRNIQYRLTNYILTSKRFNSFLFHTANYFVTTRVEYIIAFDPCGASNVMTIQHRLDSYKSYFRCAMVVYKCRLWHSRGALELHVSHLGLYDVTVPESHALHLGYCAFPVSNTVGGLSTRANKSWWYNRGLL